MTSKSSRAHDPVPFEGRRWRRPTIHDVARRAGVSTTTVMRVIQNSPHGLREETRRHVGRVIEAMDFVPNPVARALASGTSRRIGVVADGAELPSTSTIVASLEGAARRYGFSTAVSTIADGAGHSLSVAVRDVLSQGVDGLIIVATQMSTLADVQQTTPPLPNLTITSGRISDGSTRIWKDQRAGARLAIRHLAASGHQSIAHIGGPVSSCDARERLQGWKESSTSLGLRSSPLIVGEWSSDFGYEAARSLNPGQTRAIFAASDQIAIGVLHALYERDLRVPEDVEVVGYDDMPEARYLSPPLTTIRHDDDAVARSALSVLMRLVEGVRLDDGQDTMRDDNVFGPTLIARATTRAHGDVG